MNRDKIGTQTCYVHQRTFVGTLMYIACLCPNLVSVHFYAIPIFNTLQISYIFYLLVSYHFFTIVSNNSH